MLKKFTSSFFKNLKILGLIFLIIFTIVVVILSNYQKNLNSNQYNNFVNNIYLKKILNEIINNLEPRYKKYSHKIKSGETFDGILNAYPIDMKEINIIKENISKKLILIN